MAKDELEQLRNTEVPPLPEDFDNQIHQQLNDWLLASHLIEVGTRALPLTLGHFAQAVGAALMFSLTGRFHPLDRKGPNDGKK